jgi:cytochrome c551/c552
MDESQSGRRSRILKIIAVVAIVAVAVEVLSYLIVDKSNPDVVSEPNWAAVDPQVKTLAQDACFDCHSNETEWPWYANIAPASWLLWNDVRGGRDALNFSEWNGRRARTRELAEVINEGEMPPWYYTLMHPKAKLSDQEKQILIDGLNAAIGQTNSGTATGQARPTNSTN